MPTGTELALLSRNTRKRFFSSSTGRPYSGSTSSAAADRNRSTCGRRAARARHSSRPWPEPVTVHANRDCGASSSAALRDGDLELVQFAVQGVAADIERLGDVAHVPAVLFKQPQQHLPLGGLDDVEPLGGGLRCGGRRLGAGACWQRLRRRSLQRRKVLVVDDVAVGQ